ncbi:septum formation initiator [Leptospira perolatii]|uniref:Septum formation initiator n=1 Tax=Leptospira perolatii TaxID=2023191 RepID=A0A2M9ZR26_9LEPT|nr:septum formation initiator family protein [Leptospira perolatii]PJZ68385.1 septum formation initiator [Leptospira perolatii]PJZ74419.1 septum formation initiator [Leptospira perolatii]
MGTSLANKLFYLLVFFASLFYFLILGESGLVVRSQMEKSLSELRLDVERLEYENRQLEERQKLLLDDKIALEREARKYYLLSESAHIIKFREPEPRSEIKPVLASRLIALKAGKDLPVPPIQLLRFFYVSFVAFLFIGVFRKLRRKKLEL